VLGLLEQHRPKPEEPDLRGFEWHYLYRLCKRLTSSSLSTRQPAPPFLTDVAFTPDGKRLTGVTLGWRRGPGTGVATNARPLN